MDLLTIAKKIADRVEAESLKYPTSGCWSPVRFHRGPAPTPRAAARIYAGWANLRRGMTAR